MKCHLCLGIFENVRSLNGHVMKDHPVYLNEEQTYVKVSISTTNLLQLLQAI